MSVSARLGAPRENYKVAIAFVEAKQVETVNIEQIIGAN